MGSDLRVGLGRPGRCGVRGLGSVTVGHAGAGLLYSVVGTLMRKPAAPRRSPAPARTASATGRGGTASLPGCAATPASRSCGPATCSIAPPGSHGPSESRTSRPAPRLHRGAEAARPPRRCRSVRGRPGRTGSCRCTTTMAGLRHTGSTERLLGFGSAVRRFGTAGFGSMGGVRAWVKSWAYAARLGRNSVNPGGFPLYSCYRCRRFDRANRRDFVSSVA